MLWGGGRYAFMDTDEVLVEAKLLEELKSVCPDGNCDEKNIILAYKEFFNSRGYSFPFSEYL